MNVNTLTLQQHLQQLNSATGVTAGAPFASMPAAPGSVGGSGMAGSDFAELLRRTNNTRQGNDTTPLPRVPAIVENMELYELALELEQILVQNMLRGMRNTVQRTNLIDTGFAGEIYEDMLFDEYARILTRNAGFGFAEMAYRELSGHGHGPRR